MAWIYKITSPKKRVYVGSTLNIKVRWKMYKRLSCKSQTKLYRSFIKYGVNSHTFEIITECTEEEMYRLESTYGDLYQVLHQKRGLNCALPKNGQFYQCKSEETKNKLSLVNKGKGREFGYSHTDESKLLMSLSRLGFKPSDTHRQNMSAAAYNREKPARTRLTFNTETGIYYDTLIEAWESTNKKTTSSYLKQMLLGYKPNKTPFVYP